MKVTLDMLREIISETLDEAGWEPSPEVQDRMAQQAEIRGRFEESAERFLSERLPQFESQLHALQEEAREIMGMLEGYGEPHDEVDGYEQLQNLVDLDLHGAMQDVGNYWLGYDDSYGMNDDED